MTKVQRRQVRRVMWLLSADKLAMMACIVEQQGAAASTEQSGAPGNPAAAEMAPV